MGSLIGQITSLSDAKYGVNIYEKSPPQNISGAKTNIAGVVGNFPWGPVAEVTDITSAAQLFSTFCPLPFEAEDDYAAMRAFLNKKFPGGLKAVRALASGAAIADMDFDDEDSTESVTVTANYAGLLGCSVEVAWSANADTPTNRDMTVSIGTKYSKTYPNVVTAALVVTDPGDPYCTVTKHASCVKVPDAVVATALTGGLDGTLVGSDLVGALGTEVGIRKFCDEAVRPNVLFVADVGDDDTIIDAVNVGLKAYAVDNDKGLAVLLTKYDQAVADVITDAASYVDDRVVYPFPLCKTTNMYDANLAEIEVQGASFMASAIVSNDPWQAPGGAASVEALKGITGLEDIVITRLNYQSLFEAGIAPFFMSSALGGAIVHRAVTVAADGTRIFRRRMTDYICESIAAYLEFFVERPIDLDLDNRTLGNWTKAEVDAVTTFLQNQKSAQHIKAFGVNPFDANTEESLDAGQWVLAIQVELYSMQEVIVLQAEIGETVEVAESA
jgi:hypothetical protein